MSNITAPVDASKRSLVVICHGLNMQLTENVVSTHTVNILRKYLSFLALSLIANERQGRCGQESFALIMFSVP